MPLCPLEHEAGQTMGKPALTGILQEKQQEIRPSRDGGPVFDACTPVIDTPEIASFPAPPAGCLPGRVSQGSGTYGGEPRKPLRLYPHLAKPRTGYRRSQVLWRVE